MGETEKDSKDEYIPNNLCPVFGKCFEFTATLPQDFKLKVKVMDHDIGSLPDLIGETDIDLENRWLTRHRAVCGLPEAYMRFCWSLIFFRCTCTCFNQRFVA